MSSGGEEEAAAYRRTHHSGPRGSDSLTFCSVFIYLLNFFPARRSQWWPEHHYLAAQHDCWLCSWSWQMDRAHHHHDTGGRLEQQARLIRSLESPSCLRKQTSARQGWRGTLALLKQWGKIITRGDAVPLNADAPGVGPQHCGDDIMMEWKVLEAWLYTIQHTRLPHVNYI